MSAFLANLAARLAVGVLQWWAQRQDIRNAVRAKGALEAVKLANQALDWKVGAVADPDAAARLRDSGGHITLPGEDANPGGSS